MEKLGISVCFYWIIIRHILSVKIYPLAINAITFIVMTVSIIGVLQSVLNKRKIKCACLGSVLNLPMSTITILEDALMISSAAMMVSLL